MKVRCPICDTENRGIAKFCIECVNPLPTALAAPGFARTEYAPPPEPPRKPKSTSAFAPAAEPRKSVWLSVGGLVVALVVGTAAGWMLAGPDAVYKLEPEAPPPAMPAAPAPALVMPIALPAPTVEPTPAEPGAAVPQTYSLSPHPTRDEVAKPVAPARIPNRPQAEAVDPGAACAGLNFFAAARCMAAQCLKPAFKPHPQCEAVRRQQRIEEEKRNPILAN
ncbi:hypothetical protein [Variovorax sp. GT1P44]|uniref:hypothetical protein n=1 Tax=Variovorax sp. GT1P44 TaxID=3443742 RepID=UPI003F44DF5D